MKLGEFEDLDKALTLHEIALKVAPEEYSNFPELLNIAVLLRENSLFKPSDDAFQFCTRLFQISLPLIRSFQYPEDRFDYKAAFSIQSDKSETLGLLYEVGHLFGKNQSGQGDSSPETGISTLSESIF